jgi:hypothetical protein
MYFSEGRRCACPELNTLLFTGLDVVHTRDVGNVIVEQIDATSMYPFGGRDGGSSKEDGKQFHAVG